MVVRTLEVVAKIMAAQRNRIVVQTDHPVVERVERVRRLRQPVPLPHPVTLLQALMPHPTRLLTLRQADLEDW